MIRESAIRKALKLRVEAYGGEIRAVAYLGRRHCPDVLCLFPINSVFDQKFVSDVDGTLWDKLHPMVETKRPNKTATEGQAREHERLRAAGFEVLLITTHSELDAWLPPL